jgi:hypothetical protein
MQINTPSLSTHLQVINPREPALLDNGFGLAAAAFLTLFFLGAAFLALFFLGAAFFITFFLEAAFFFLDGCDALAITNV